jgi:hypothetical protein
MAEKKSSTKRPETQDETGNVYGKLTVLKHRVATRRMSSTPEYTCWAQLKSRCENIRHRQYHRYGARGITVCSRWRIAFANFYEDMGPRPSPAHSIDRIDNDGNYSCGKCEECLAKGWIANCRWATHTEQQQNTRYTRLLTHNGQTKCMSEWAREYGLATERIHARLASGWPVSAAITTPAAARKKHPLFAFAGKTQNIEQWARDIGIHPATLRSRLVNEWPVERALTEPARPRAKSDIESLKP